MPATRQPVKIRLSVGFDGQTRAAGKNKIASCGGSAVVIEVNGTTLHEPWRAGVVFVQVWDRSGCPSPLFDGVAATQPGDVLELVGGLEPNARPPKGWKKGDDWDAMANWRLEATSGRRLRGAELAAAEVDGSFVDENKPESEPAF